MRFEWPPALSQSYARQLTIPPSGVAIHGRASEPLERDVPPVMPTVERDANTDTASPSAVEAARIGGRPGAHPRGLRTGGTHGAMLLSVPRFEG